MSKSDRAAQNAALKAAAEALVPLVAEANAEEDEHDKTIAEEMLRHDKTIGTLFVRIAVQLASGAAASEALGRDWKVWAKARLSGLRKNVSPPTVYRLKNAGTVAAILGDAVGEAAYTALVPLYRFVTEAKTEDERTAAEENIRAVWAEACKASAPMSPTEESVRTLAEAKTGTSRGAQGRTAAGRKKAQTAKNARAKNTPTETTENDGKGNEETVTIDPAAVESAAKIVGTMIGRRVKAGTDETIVRSIMLETIRLVREHGADTIAATLAVSKTGK